MSDLDKKPEAAPLDKATVQWCVNRVSALIERRVQGRKQKRRTRDDDIIAATALFIVTEYEKSLRDEPQAAIARAEGSSHA